MPEWRWKDRPGIRLNTETFRWAIRSANRWAIRSAEVNLNYPLRPIFAVQITGFAQRVAQRKSNLFCDLAHCIFVAVIFTVEYCAAGLPVSYCENHGRWWSTVNLKYSMLLWTTQYATVKITVLLCNTVNTVYSMLLWSVRLATVIFL